MKRTLLLGESSFNHLPFTDRPGEVLSGKDVPKGDKRLFKEAAASLLWEKKGIPLFLKPSELPAGVSLLDTLIWLDQEAPSEALLLFPLTTLHPAALPKGGPWVPVVEKGEPPLLLYYLLLESKDLVQGVAVESAGLSEETAALFISPFRECEEKAPSFLFKQRDYYSAWKSFLLKVS